MKTVACIIARTNSKRLLKKVLLDICGKKLIEYIIDKVKLVPNLDAIYLCTSIDPDDQILLEIAKQNGIKSYAGSRTSVIDRMLAVAEIEKADNVVRITGDNIFTDEIFLTKMIEEHNKDPSIDYTRTEFLPLGVTAEVIKVEALKDCYKKMDPDKSEYLMSYMFNPDAYNCLVLLPEKSLQAEYASLSVDTPDDLARTELIVRKTYQNNRIFYDEILKLNQKTRIPNFEVSADLPIKLPDGKEISYNDFRKGVIAAKIAKSKKIQLKEGFYASQKAVNKFKPLKIKSKPLKIKNIEIGSKRCFVIAEIASSHCGDPELLKTIFKNSVEAGADAVKVQIFDGDELCSKYNPDYANVKQIEISSEKWREVLHYVSSFNTIAFAEVFDEKSLELAAPFVDGLSIHATDLTNPIMLKLVAEKGKPLILNVGGSTLDEIKQAVDVVEKTGNHEIILMYGIQNFPTDITTVNLNRIQTLKNEFSYPIGYHDHTEADHPLALTLPLTAFARGAQIIEKHITDERKKKGFDYISSLHKDEFTELVHQIRYLESSFGSSEIVLSQADQIYRKRFRKYIVAQEGLKAGTIIQANHLAFKRTQGGIVPLEKDKIINKKLAKDVAGDQAINEEDLCDEEEWGYVETDEKLTTRINIHQNFSENDIDPWIMGLTDVKQNDVVLDIGCGNGKQVLAYAEKNREGKIFGMDISDELLNKAKEKANSKGFENITLINHDINKPFEFYNETFDLISSCFSVYYVHDASKLINRLKQLLKNRGRIFICGPSPNNCQEFWELHSKVTGKEISEIALKRRARINEEFLPLIKNSFSNVDVSIFNNSLNFPSVEHVLDFYTSSLLFKESYNSEEEKARIIGKMTDEVRKVLKRDGKFTIRKEVIGIRAIKEN